MPKRPLLLPAMLDKPRAKSRYSKAEEPEEEDDEDEGKECGCGHHDDKGVVIKISLLLPDMLQPKSRRE